MVAKCVELACIMDAPTKKKNSLMNQVNWKHGSVQSWPGH